MSSAHTCMFCSVIPLLVTVVLVTHPGTVAQFLSTLSVLLFTLSSNCLLSLRYLKHPTFNLRISVCFSPSPLCTPPLTKLTCHCHPLSSIYLCVHLFVCLVCVHAYLCVCVCSSASGQWGVVELSSPPVTLVFPGLPTYSTL